VIAFSSSAIATARAFSTTAMVRALQFVASQPNHGGTDMSETSIALHTIETAALADVTGAGQNSSGQNNIVDGAVKWAQETGSQVVNHFFPKWGVQGDTPTPGGGRAQYAAGDTPALPKMKSMPKQRG
jgi:hypothetical protein